LIRRASTHGLVKEDWAASWINTPTGHIAGGADEMLLNTIAEKILGLPQAHRPGKGVPFKDIPACRNAARIAWKSARAMRADGLPRRDA